MAYSYNTANAGSYGAQDLNPTRKKKPNVAQAPYGQPQPVAGGPTQNVGGPAAGNLGTGAPAGTAKPMPTGGTSRWPGATASPNPGGKDVYSWDQSIRTPVTSGPRPPSPPPSPGGGQLGDIDQGQGSEDENDQALLDVINELLTEGPRSTEEIEGVIGEQYDRAMQEELGRVMAAAGAGGMGSSGQLGYGMADVARASALDRQGAVLEAQRQAEKDWLDQINAAGDLYGTDLELRSMEDYYRLMESIIGGEGEGGEGSVVDEGLDDPLVDAVSEATTLDEMSSGLHSAATTSPIVFPGSVYLGQTQDGKHQYRGPGGMIYFGPPPPYGYDTPDAPNPGTGGTGGSSQDSTRVSIGGGR